MLRVKNSFQNLLVRLRFLDWVGRLETPRVVESGHLSFSYGHTIAKIYRISTLYSPYIFVEHTLRWMGMRRPEKSSFVL